MPDFRPFDAPGLGFTRPVPQNGYAWWYIDALSADGEHGLTIIGFIGSVFSPYYARARARGIGDPYDHCAINIALYRRKTRHQGGNWARIWAMTERGRGQLKASVETLQIGQSALHWDQDSGLTIKIRETSMPWLRRLSGTIRLYPEHCLHEAYSLDAGGQHLWRPIAPLARVELALDAPELAWSGQGYLDSNFGAEPLEQAFSTWDWSRSESDRGGSSCVLYDLRDLQGLERQISLRFSKEGKVEPLLAGSLAELPTSPWGMRRSTRYSTNSPPVLAATLEDSPFYTRSLLRSEGQEGAIMAVHESLSLTKFKMPVVQKMLPFRMPRVWW